MTETRQAIRSNYKRRPACLLKQQVPFIQTVDHQTLLKKDLQWQRKMDLLVKKSGERYVEEYCLHLSVLNETHENPNNKQWIATVYIDPDRYGDDLAIERIKTFYNKKYPLKQIDFRFMKTHDLRYRSVFYSKISEEDFIQRGYAIDTENFDYDKGAGGDNLVHAKAAQAAADHHLCKVMAFSSDTKLSYDKIKPEWAKWLSSLMGREVNVIESVDPANQKRKIKTKVIIKVPLICKNGTYRPVALEEKKYPVVHVAYDRAIKPALESGHADEFKLTWATSDDIRAQIRFEMRHASQIFAGATHGALLTWQIQVLAILRKAAWECAFEKSSAMRQAENDIEEARRIMLKNIRREGRAAFNLKDNTAFAKAREKALELYIGNRTGKGSDDNQVSDKYEKTKFVHTMSEEEILIAVVHGSPYRPVFDQDCPFDRKNLFFYLFDLAIWIGDLKRQKTGVLDEGIAHRILTIFGQIDHGDDSDGFDLSQLPRFQRYFFNLLHGSVWNSLKLFAKDVFDGRDPIPVRYQWIGRTADIWEVQLESKSLLIFGPLLDFPRKDVRKWRAQSRKVHLPKTNLSD